MSDNVVKLEKRPAADLPPAPKCCKAGCEELALVEIRHGPQIDDYTHACTAHIGDLLTDSQKHEIFWIAPNKAIRI